MLGDRFFREGGLRPCSQILSLRICNMPTVSKSAGRIYLWCTVSTDYSGVNVYV